MTIAPLDPAELPALGEFLREAGATVPQPNLEQFSMPRTAGPGPGVATLVLKEGGRILGSIGYLDIPLALSEGGAGGPGTRREELARWPINHFLLAECRGRGLGKQLMEAAWEGAPCLLAIGGTETSIPARNKTGWRPIGQLTCWRFKAPARGLLATGKLRDRRNTMSRRVPPDSVSLRPAGREIIARRTRELSGWLPWVTPDPPSARPEIGAPRDAAYLRFAFNGALSKYHVIYTVSVNGALAGYFVLAARSDRRPFLSIEIVDIDAAPGFETEVIEAARATGFTRADVVRLRLGGDRLTMALRSLRGDIKESPDHAFRISSRPGSLVEEPAAASLQAWHLTYGDHDQYRVRTASLIWSED